VSSQKSVSVVVIHLNLMHTRHWPFIRFYDTLLLLNIVRNRSCRKMWNILPPCLVFLR